jgi:UDP-glucose 4-epimerase
VVGRPVAWQSAPRRPGDPAVLYAASDRAQRELGWRPRYPDLDVIVQHAWQWHSTHPKGYVG